jgi:hypothetical protein
VTLNHIDTPLKSVIARLAVNCHRRSVSAEEKIEWVSKIAELTGWKSPRIAEEIGMSESWVLKYLSARELYVRLEHVIFGECGNDEFTVKVAEKPEEVKELLELGFEYVCQKDNLIFLRKRR